MGCRGLSRACRGPSWYVGGSRGMSWLIEGFRGKSRDVKGKSWHQGLEVRDPKPNPNRRLGLG